MEREVGTDSLTLLGGWQAPGPDDEAPPIFHVQAARLEREISAKNFLIWYAFQYDLRIHLMREISVASADMLMEQPIEGEPFLERTAAVIEGDRVFLLTGIAHASRYPEVEEMFGAMIASFRILTPSPRRTIERWEDCALLGDAVRFRHPASFRPTLVDGSDDQRAIVGLHGLDVEGAISGIIHVEAARGAPLALDDEHARILAAIRPSGITPSGDPSEVPLEAEGGSIRPLGMRRYPALIEGNELEHEIWIALMCSDSLVVRVWMTTPDKKSSFLHWATNRRALEILLGSLAAA
jgi:hypothetical protein